MGLAITGYITSDALPEGFIPHNVQNHAIRSFVEAKGNQYALSWTEYKGQAPLVLSSLLEESFYQGICFYSIEQMKLPLSDGSIDTPKAWSLLTEFSKRNLWIGFAREGFYFHGEMGFEEVKKLLQLKLILSQKQSQDLWAKLKTLLPTIT